MANNPAEDGENSVEDFVLKHVTNEGHAATITEVVVKEHKLTLEQLPTLTDDDQKELFKEMGPRKSFQALMKALKMIRKRQQSLPQIDHCQDPGEGDSDSRYPLQRSQSMDTRTEESSQSHGKSHPASQQVRAQAATASSPIQYTLHSASGHDTLAVEKEVDDENHIAFYRIGKIPFKLGENNDPTTAAKVLLFVGMTGVGKGTLVDALGNYLWGTQTPISQYAPMSYFKFTPVMRKKTSESQTSEIGVYQFEHQPQFPVQYPVTIIDTPGFADTGGIDQDNNTALQLKYLLTQYFDHLHAIVLVVKASDARASPIQKYILNHIQQLFGSDIKENIYVVATHSDSKKIRALESLKEVGFPFTTEKVFAVDNAFLNEGALDDEDLVELNAIKWKRNRTTYGKMLDSIASISPASLEQTRETLLEQQGLANVINSFNKHIYDGVLKSSELKTMQDILTGTVGAKTLVPKQVKKKIPAKNNTTAFNCPKCQRTCDHPCNKRSTVASWLKKVPQIGSAIASKYWCYILNETYCSLCKCPSNEHVFEPFVHTTGTEMVEMPGSDSILKDEKRKSEKLEQIQQELEVIKMENIRLLHAMKRTMDRLNQISLTQSQITPANFIGRLIEEERNNSGASRSAERVLYLEDLRRTAMQL